MLQDVALLKRAEATASTRRPGDEVGCESRGRRPPGRRVARIIVFHSRSDLHSGSGGLPYLKPLLRRLVRSGAAGRLRTWLAEPEMNGSAAAPPQPRFNFIHIPKTGGTFVTQCENCCRSIVFPIRNLGHSTLVDRDWQLLWDVPAPFGEAHAIPRAGLDGSVVFSNVRNLFAFFVSYFHHAAGSIDKYRNPHHYDFAAANKGFDYLLKTIADRDDVLPIS